ncbi:hypothetical protein BDV18DRAFT_77656 [Aspergillus unguis]
MSSVDKKGNSGSESFILHVLCPSLPPPNRFTLNDLPPSTTIADLKVRISQSIPSRPNPDSQKLLYLGKLLLDGNVTLQSLFEPLDGSEFSIHLILPPSLPQPVTFSHQNSSQTSIFETNPPREPLVQSQRLRHRPNPMRPDEIAQSLHENARRRLAEVQELQQNGDLLPMPAANRPVFPSFNSGLQTPYHLSASYTPLRPTRISSMAAFSNTTAMDPRDTTDGIQLPEESRARLRLLKQYISLAEEQLNCGIAPTIDHVIQLRSHLFKLLDEQLRRPQSERGEFIEPLITRVFDISARADSLRQPRLLPIRTGSTLEHASHGPTAPMYILSAPDGYQALCTPSIAPETPGAAQTAQPAFAVADQQANAQPNAQPNADAVVMENVVRRAVLNQRPVAEGQFGLGRNLRRLWLFMRLYFFCHMFSAPGSQTRFLYVTLALIAALLAETSVPRRVYEMVLAPVQRHLEGLVHFTPDEQLQPRQNGADSTANQGIEAQRVRDGNRAAGIYHNLRRVERSAALFLASLVPGVGERQIEVRNAAEAARNAELERQEEERRRQEEAATNAEENTPADDEAIAQAGTGTGALNEAQAAISQEAH